MRQGPFLFDAAWDTVRKEVGRVKRIPWVTYETMQKGYLFAGEQLVLDPGAYYLAVEAEDRKANENLSHASSMEEAHEQLMASAGHRKNILDARWTHLGVELGTRDGVGVGKVELGGVAQRGGHYQP